MADSYRWLGVVPPGAERIRARRRDREDKLALLRRWGLRADGTKAVPELSAEQERKPAAVLSLVPGFSSEAAGPDTSQARLSPDLEAQAGRPDRHPQRPIQ